MGFDLMFHGAEEARRAYKPLLLWTERSMLACGTLCWSSHVRLDMETSHDKWQMANHENSAASRFAWRRVSFPIPARADPLKLHTKVVVLKGTKYLLSHIPASASRDLIKSDQVRGQQMERWYGVPLSAYIIPSLSPWNINLPRHRSDAGVSVYFQDF